MPSKDTPTTQPPEGENAQQPAPETPASPETGETAETQDVK